MTSNPNIGKIHRNQNDKKQNHSPIEINGNSSKHHRRLSSFGLQGNNEKDSLTDRKSVESITYLMGNKNESIISINNEEKIMNYNNTNYTSVAHLNGLDSKQKKLEIDNND